MRADVQVRLVIVPVYWREAKAYIAAVHRHHEPGANGRFSIGVEDDAGQLRGVAVMGRPKARMLPHKQIMEVTRVATDGCPNACSALYGAACRLHRNHGYRKAITYILRSEPGTSLRAAGWRPVALTEDDASWDRRKRRRDDKHPLEQKVRWECRHSELPELTWAAIEHEQEPKP